MPGDAHPLSFRDPIAQVIAVDGAIYRAVHIEHAGQVEALLAQPWLHKRMARGDVPASAWCERPAGCESWGEGWRWISHRTLDFALHPHETTSQQLHDSALLTLGLAEEALNAGYLLKDASAWNVLHAEGRAVFVDLTSFVPHDGHPLWLAYAQFGRHFVIPLLLAYHLQMAPADIFLRYRDGMPPERARQLLGPRRSFSSLAAIEFVGLPAMLSGAKLAKAPPRPEGGAIQRAVQAHAALIARLRGIVRSLEPGRRRRTTTWSGYTAQRDHYTADGLALKHAFLTRRLAAGKGRLLDLGCNTGEYALHAARAGRPVVAADVDEQSLQILHIEKGALPVTVLLLDLANPGPGLGWGNAEVAPTLARAWPLRHRAVRGLVAPPAGNGARADCGRAGFPGRPGARRTPHRVDSAAGPQVSGDCKRQLGALPASGSVRIRVRTLLTLDVDERMAVQGNERVLYALLRAIGPD